MQIKPNVKEQSFPHGKAANFISEKKGEVQLAPVTVVFVSWINEVQNYFKSLRQLFGTNAFDTAHGPSKNA